MSLAAIVGQLCKEVFLAIGDLVWGDLIRRGSRDAIQKIAVEWSSYGRQRMTKELRRRGWRAARSRFNRLWIRRLAAILAADV
jgi:hypothetical protein